VFVYLGQLLAQLKKYFLVVLPTLYMHMYMFLCFVHGQINDDDDDDEVHKLFNISYTGRDQRERSHKAETKNLQ